MPRTKRKQKTSTHLLFAFPPCWKPHLGQHPRVPPHRPSLFLPHPVTRWVSMRLCWFFTPLLGHVMEFLFTVRDLPELQGQVPPILPHAVLHLDPKQQDGLRFLLYVQKKKRGGEKKRKKKKRIWGAGQHPEPQHGLLETNLQHHAQNRTHGKPVRIYKLK